MYVCSIDAQVCLSNFEFSVLKDFSILLFYISSIGFLQCSYIKGVGFFVKVLKPGDK